MSVVNKSPGKYFLLEVVGLGLSVLCGRNEKNKVVMATPKLKGSSSVLVVQKKETRIPIKKKTSLSSLSCVSAIEKLRIPEHDEIENLLDYIHNLQKQILLQDRVLETERRENQITQKEYMHRLSKLDHLRQNYGDDLLLKLISYKLVSGCELQYFLEVLEYKIVSDLGKTHLDIIQHWPREVQLSSLPKQISSKIPKVCTLTKQQRNLICADRTRR
eukprot:snap_masked-scaffold_11-processed-gene-4.33-mRNA-1 protein AED:1.00 eAED:1.00 QI:0/-1/0/0/-1/1/1/0/216